MSRFHTYTCPKCGGHSLKVHATVDVPLDDYGTKLDDIEFGEPDGYQFDISSGAYCTQCQHQSIVHDFRITAARARAKFGFNKSTPVNDWSLFDGIEVHPCTITVAQGGEEGVERVDEGDDNIDMWTVYLHCVSGGAESYVDVATSAEADLVAERLYALHPELRRTGVYSDLPTWPAAREFYGLDESFQYSEDGMLGYIAMYFERETAAPLGTPVLVTAPPNPENEARRKRAVSILRTYALNSGTDEALTDLLTDLLHADATAFDDALTMARVHFSSERAS